jgi:HNH endonuclease
VSRFIGSGRFAGDRNVAFSEAVKKEAKKRAHYQCVVCHQPFVEVRHIVPRKDVGTDDLDNAAPLCGSCHDLFGGNPEKRKQLKEMRDFWWEFYEKRAREPSVTATFERLDELNLELQAVRQNQIRAVEILGEIKRTLAGHYANSERAVTAANSFAEVVEASGTYATGVKLVTHVRGNVSCKKCGSYFGLLVGSDVCPVCGEGLD